MFWHVDTEALSHLLAYCEGKLNFEHANCLVIFKNDDFNLSACKLLNSSMGLVCFQPRSKHRQDGKRSQLIWSFSVP